MARETRARGAYVRLSREEKAAFLEVLSQTGNRKAAAEAIGIEPRLMDQRREHDPLLDREWREALDMAHRRLSGAEGPFDCPAGAKLDVVKRGRSGRLQLVASGPKRWNKAVEDRFVAALAVCGCIAAAARAVGFSESCVHQRRRQWPDFERRIEAALEDAEIAIEYRCALDAGGFAGPFEGAARGQSLVTVPSDCPSPTPLPPPAGGRGSLDREFALRFLKWREEKRRGGGGRGQRRAAAPTGEEVIEKIIRKVEAVRRHDARGGRPPEAEPDPETEAA